MPENKQKNTFRKFLVYGGFSLATTLFGLLSLPVLTSFLKPSEYGVLGLALAILSFIVPLNTLSNEQNVQVTRTKANSEYYNKFWDTLCSISFLTFFFTLTIISLSIYVFQLPHTLLLIPILAFSRSLRLLKQAEFIVIGKEFLYGFSTLMISMLSFLVSFLIFYFYMADANVRIASLIFAEILVVVFVLKMRFSFLFDFTLFKNVWHFGWPLIIATFPAWLINESSRFFLLNHYSLEVVGLYTLAFQISIIYLQFNTVLGNTFVKQIFDDISAAFKPIFILKITSIQIICALAFVITINYLGVYILPESYLSALPIANILILGVLFQSFGLLPTYYLSYHNKNKFRLYALSGAAAISIILNFFLIPIYGITGAAAAFVFSMFLYAFLMFVFVFYLNNK